MVYRINYVSSALAIALCLQPATAFSSVSERGVRSSTLLSATGDSIVTRGGFISSASAFLASTVLSFPALADDESAPVEAAPVVTRSSRSVDVCMSGTKNCVSTANIKQIEQYAPPWTFEVTPDEAFARIKGVLSSDPTYEILEVDDKARYIKANVQRTFLVMDEVEFSVKEDDKVVIYRSSEKEASFTDFGVNRKRIDEIKKRGAVFDLMGGGMTADSVDGGGAAFRGNSAMGQLKAFYGLQGGKGSQDVLLDEE